MECNGHRQKNPALRWAVAIGRHAWQALVGTVSVLGRDDRCVKARAGVR